MNNQTYVELCMMALAYIGVDADVSNIEDPSPDNPWEQRCKRHFLPTLKKVLATHMPMFAIKETNIVRSADGKFRIPADCLRVFSVNGICGDDIHEEGGEIKCDFGLFGNSITVKYVHLMQETGYWTPEFLYLFPYELACELVVYLNDAGKHRMALDLRESARREVGGLNAQRIRLKRRFKGIYKKKWHFPVR